MKYLIAKTIVKLFFLILTANLIYNAATEPEGVIAMLGLIFTASFIWACYVLVVEEGDESPNGEKEVKLFKPSDFETNKGFKIVAYAPQDCAGSPSKL